MHFILDSVLTDIAAEICSKPPERGGALLGPIDRPLITKFLFDRHAETTGVTYRPSRELADSVKQVELAEVLEFKGIIHSHPGSFDHPSGPDIYEVGVGLRLNRHLTRYFVPITTLGPLTGPLADHEVACGAGKISFFAGYRTAHEQKVRIERILIKEIPMLQDLECIRTTFGGIHAPEIFLTHIQGVQMIAGRLVLDGIEIMLLTDELYPAAPPILLITPDGGTTEQAHIPWRLDLPAEERLLTAVQTFLHLPGPFRRVYGLPNLPALTRDANRADLAGWQTFYTGQSPETTLKDVKEGLFARSAGLLAKSLQEKCVLVGGLGSVGSYAAVQFVRSGIGKVILIDHETVELANLSRTQYTASDLGKSKTAALTRHLLQINPGLEIVMHTATLQELGVPCLEALIKQCDLVFAATDDPSAQRLLNHLAYTLGVPALFTGLYAGANGGEVVITIPEQTPCYLCATRMRHAVEQPETPINPPMDYGGTGRLSSEVALGVDIQHVTGAAVKMGLSQLLPPDTGASLRSFLAPQFQEGATYLTLSMVSSYWFYPAVFQETAGQFAYQSVWLTPERWTECPICGESEYRSDPQATVLRTPQFNSNRFRQSEREPVS